jgi:hypothetical protein
VNSKEATRESVKDEKWLKTIKVKTSKKAVNDKKRTDAKKRSDSRDPLRKTRKRKEDWSTKESTWTQFWDMHSGGGQKEEKWSMIYIEAPIDEAKVIFYNRFGHNPERVTCTCCGEDYSISESKWFSQLSGFHRGCRNLVTPRDEKTGLFINQSENEEFQKHHYLEEGEDPPKGFKVEEGSYGSRLHTYLSCDEYSKKEGVLVIRKEEISDDQRRGYVPEQGYVWVD